MILEIISKLAIVGAIKISKFHSVEWLSHDKKKTKKKQENNATSFGKIRLLCSTTLPFYSFLSTVRLDSKK